MHAKTNILIIATLLSTSSFARIGDNMESAIKRYGKPLKRENFSILNGADTYTYNYKGWIIKQAYKNKKAVRTQYVKYVGNTMPQVITNEDIKNILAAEGKYSWRWEKIARKDIPAQKEYIIQAWKHKDSFNTAYLKNSREILEINDYSLDKSIPKF